MLWGTYTAIGTIVLQALWRLIGEEDWRTRKWLWVASVTAPFVLVIVADVARRVITAPWGVHQDQEEAHREREGELQAEIETQRDGRERAEAKIRELLAGPAFTGHFYQFMLFPQSGIVPPRMIQEVMDITRAEAGLEKKEYKGDLDVFVELYFVNEAPGECTIIDYSLELEIGGEWIKLRRDPSFNGWILEKEETVYDEYRLPTITTTKAEILDLGVHIAGVPLERGHGVEGWLHFVLSGVSHKQFNGIKHGLVLTITDGYGKEHKIDKMWTGSTRPGKIEWDTGKGKSS